MIFLNTITNEYPRHQGDLELLGWMPGMPLPDGWVKVEYSSYVEDLPEGHKLIEEQPINVDGTFYQNFVAVPLAEGNSVTTSASLDISNIPGLILDL